MAFVSSESLRENYGEISASIAGIVDPQVDYISPPTDRETFVSILQRNKLSREYLKQTAYEASGASLDKFHRDVRNQRLKWVSALFDKAGLDCVLMKNLRTPKTTMSDIDFLVPDPGELANALRLLYCEGFNFYRFRLVAHPLKTMAVAADEAAVSGTEEGHLCPIDFYPDAIWIRKRVGDPYRIVQRANQSADPKLTPEDDLYLVATHAFSHLGITFAEMYHGLVVLEESDTFDWTYVMDIADDFGCADALYFYLRTLDEYSSSTGRDLIPPHVIETLQGYLVNRAIQRWYDRIDTYRFPVSIPIRYACGASIFHHVPRVVRHSSLRGTWKDLESHLLIAVSKLLLGEA